MTMTKRTTSRKSAATKSTDEVNARISALEAKIDSVLSLIADSAKTQQVQPNVTPSSEMTEAERDEMIETQNRQLKTFAQKYQLVPFEVTGYSFKQMSNGKLGNHTMTEQEKADFEAIFNSGDQLRLCGLNSGKSIITFVNVAECQKVEF